MSSLHSSELLLELRKIFHGSFPKKEFLNLAGDSFWKLICELDVLWKLVSSKTFFAESDDVFFRDGIVFQLNVRGDLFSQSGRWNADDVAIKNLKKYLIRLFFSKNSNLLVSGDEILDLSWLNVFSSSDKHVF